MAMFYFSGVIWFLCNVSLKPQTQSHNTYNRFSLTLNTYIGYPQHNKLTKKNNSGPLLLPGGPNTIDLKESKTCINNHRYMLLSFIPSSKWKCHFITYSTNKSQISLGIKKAEESFHCPKKTLKRPQKFQWKTILAPILWNRCISWSIYRYSILEKNRYSHCEGSNYGKTLFIWDDRKTFLEV